MRPILSAIIAVGGLFLTDEEKGLLAEYNPLGVTIFGRNIRDKSQLKSLVQDIKNTMEREDVLIAIDQEGGRVRRLTEPEWRPYASEMTLGRIDAKATKYHADLISNDLLEMGINLNFAPVIDIRNDNTTPALKSRCFSDNKEVVAELGGIMVDEYITNGICPCIKHMPGKGTSTVDSHLQLPVIDLSFDEMQKDFYPFKKLNYAPCAMTGHILISSIDEKYPLTQSAKGIENIIRGEIGFDGLLISDALDMKSLTGSFGEKAKASIEAGCDATCMYSANAKDIDDVCRHSKILSDKSLIRFEKIKNIFNNKVGDINISEVSEKYDELVGNVDDYIEEYDATEILKKMEQGES